MLPKRIVIAIIVFVIVLPHILFTSLIDFCNIYSVVIFTLMSEASCRIELSQSELLLISCDDPTVLLRAPRQSRSRRRDRSRHRFRADFPPLPRPLPHATPLPSGARRKYLARFGGGGGSGGGGPGGRHPSWAAAAGYSGPPPPPPGLVSGPGLAALHASDEHRSQARLQLHAEAAPNAPRPRL